MLETGVANYLRARLGVVPVMFFGGVMFLVAERLDAQVRTWTDFSGTFRTEAEFVDYADGVVRIRKTSTGSTIRVPLEKLSLPDQQYVVDQADKGPGGLTASSPENSSALIELLTGSKVEGKIVERNDQSITLATTVGRRTLTRDYPLDRIHAITIDGSRSVINGLSGGNGPASGAASAGVSRSVTEVERVIDQLGRTQPDWWESVSLNYPKSLDLSWPSRPPPPWNPQKNVGQYLWDIIQPNPGKWREGLRLVHHLLDKHKSNSEKRQRAMMTLGRLYYLLLQDYARAAFWWQQAGVEESGDPQAVNLAACYWKLGSKQMALKFVGSMRVTYLSAIKLLADMGETEKALGIVEAGARSGYGDMAYLYAGDAYRINGLYGKALEYYEKVLGVRAAGRGWKRVERNQQRARENIEAIKIYDALDLGKVASGTYRARAAGYAGDVHVEVVVQNGRIASVEVVQHKEKQYYTALTETPMKIIAKQGVKGVDATTSATITSEAIINATARALARGLK